MRKFLLLFLLSIFITACNDGDIITVNIDFDQELDLCENDTENYIVYDVRTDPAESFSLVFPRNTANDLIFEPTESPYEVTLENLSSTGVNKFNYRTYNQEPEFCTSIPNSNIIIQEDYEAQGGAVNVVTTFIDSDDDGIPNEDEDDNLDLDDNYLTNPLDTDGDGLPNYIDQDDDNDNVLTKDEDDNTDEDDNPFTNPRDTDDDGIADYLDEDDDNDGIITRLEDEDENRNPLNDFLTGTVGELPRFLDDTATQEFPAPNPEFRVVSYTRDITVTFSIIDLGIEILNTDFLQFGTYTKTEPFSFDNNE